MLHLTCSCTNTCWVLHNGCAVTVCYWYQRTTGSALSLVLNAHTALHAGVGCHCNLSARVLLHVHTDTVFWSATCGTHVLCAYLVDCSEVQRLPTRRIYHLRQHANKDTASWTKHCTCCCLTALVSHQPTQKPVP
jgi:hypothetical protein